MPNTDPDKRREYNRLWYQRNRERSNAMSSARRKLTGQRGGILRKKYGLSLGEYADVLASQGGVCAICKRPDPIRPLSVDHCHSTKAIRGLLCSKCNPGLGWFRDRPDLMRKAAAYLKAHREKP